ncbi:hypothetical protein MOSE0_F00870 [Monosporozyma servazzii]
MTTYHRMRSSREDAELDGFLSNVENLNRATHGDMEDDLDNLAYKSAYNYDRTFNSNKEDTGKYPSDNGIDIDGEYVVSKEDYILLQKIKQQQQQPKQTQNLPSRGAPRGRHQDQLQTDKVKIDEPGPKLPPRKPKELARIDPYEQRFERYSKASLKNNSQSNNEENEEFTPALPKRNHNNAKLDLVKDNSVSRINNSNHETSKKPQIIPREVSDNTIEIQERNKPKPLPKTPPKHDFVNLKYSQNIELIDLTADDDVSDKKENRPKLPPKPSLNGNLKPVAKKDLKSSVHKESKPIVKRESKPMQMVSPEPVEISAPKSRFNRESKPSIPTKLSNDRDFRPSSNTDSKPSINRDSKPLIPTKPSIDRDSKPVGFINSLQNNVLTTSNVSNKANHSPTRSKPMGYLDSMQNNSTTSISTKMDTLPSSPTRNSKQLDYLDSMQGNSTTTVTTHKPLSPSKPITRSPKSESFIESALKNSESTSNLSLKKKPLLPTKPKNLNESKDHTSMISPKHEDLIELPQLRKVEKPSPASPHRNIVQENILLPKLQPVMKKKTPPPVNKDNKPSGIELLNLQSVKKMPPPIHKDKKPDLPEALLKRDNLTKSGGFRQLDKSKTVPMIPERKISMPEALKKAEQLKQKKNQPSPTTEGESSPSSSIEDKLSSVLQLHKRHTMGDAPSSFSGSSINTFPSSKTSSVSVSTQHSSSSLPQLTKRRAKGPKRKLPTKI